MTSKDKKFLGTIIGMLVVIVILLVAMLYLINKSNKSAGNKEPAVIIETTIAPTKEEPTTEEPTSEEPTTTPAHVDEISSVVARQEEIESMATEEDLPWELVMILRFVEEDPIASVYFSKEDVFLSEEDMYGNVYVYIKNMESIGYFEDTMALIEVDAEEEGDSFSYFQDILEEYANSHKNE